MKLVDGLSFERTKNDEEICRGCAGGKMPRSPHPSSTSPKADHIAGRVHSDVCGPMSQDSLGGARYFVIFKDEFSGWIVVNFMKSKAEVLYHLKLLHAFLKNQTGNSIKILTTDQGTETLNAATTKWTQEMGIIHEMSVIYTPEQDGTSERVIRTVMEMARSMMTFCNAPLWIWAVAYAAYIRNRIPSGKRTESAYEVLKRVKPSVSHIKTFCSKKFVHIPDAKRKKLEPKCLVGILVGYSETTKGYRVFIPAFRKIVVSCDVLIDESIIGFGIDSMKQAATGFSSADPFAKLIEVHQNKGTEQINIDVQQIQVLNELDGPEGVGQIDGQPLENHLFPAQRFEENLLAQDIHVDEYSDS